MRRFFLIFAALLAASCGRGGGGFDSGLLRTVPSRSIAVMAFADAGEALKMLCDSSHIFRQIDLGRFGSREMLLSFDYGSALVPLLALDAGRAGRDTSEAVRRLLSQAEGLGLFCAYSADTASHSAAVLLSPSAAAVSEALFHIESGASVMDAPGFAEAAALAEGSKGSILLRNSAAGHLLPKDLPENIVPRRELVKFLSDASEWTAADFDEYSFKNLRITSYNTGKHNFMRIFEDFDGAGSEIADILPAGTLFFADLPLDDAEGYYGARKEWLDARSALRRHENACSALKSTTGLSPKAWLAASKPKEIARIVWEGGSVLALRFAKAPSAKTLIPNDIQAFPGTVFGKLFSLPDESAAVRKGKWLIIGSAAEAEAFLALQKDESFGRFPKKGLKFAIYNEGALLAGDKKGIKLSIVK